MNTKQIKIVFFNSWTDTLGNKQRIKRLGMLIDIKGSRRLIPITTNSYNLFSKSNSLYDIPKGKYSNLKDSWLSFGYEVEWDHRRWAGAIKKKFNISINELLTKRDNYRRNIGKYESPY